MSPFHKRLSSADTRCDIVAVRDIADGLVREIAGVEAQHGAERLVTAQQSAAAVRVRNADRRLVEGIAEHGFRFAQMVAGIDQIGARR